MSDAGNIDIRGQGGGSSLHHHCEVRQAILSLVGRAGLPCWSGIVICRACLLCRSDVSVSRAGLSLLPAAPGKRNGSIHGSTGRWVGWSLGGGLDGLVSRWVDGLVGRWEV